MSNSAKKPTDDDEVEQLLRAAQDDMVLKLSVNSHIARASASAAIDPDLDRRFQALKKPQSPAKVVACKKKAPAKVDTSDNKIEGAAVNDLFARFAALKNSIPSCSKNENKSSLARDESVNQQVTEEDYEDEVEKVVKWAIDAARLDPSPPSDDGDDKDNSDDDDGDDNTDDDQIIDRTYGFQN